MKFVFVNDRAPRAPSACAHCSTLIGTSYLRDLASKKLYCDAKCYFGATPPFARAGIDGLLLGLQWADEFQRALLSGLGQLEGAPAPEQPIGSSSGGHFR
jgi:hypothetical protein